MRERFKLCTYLNVSESIGMRKLIFFNSIDDDRNGRSNASDDELIPSILLKPISWMHGKHVPSERMKLFP